MAKKILIIDDEEDVIELLEMLLVSENYEVLKAENGIEAMEILKKITPALIVLDIMMPKMDGVETCKKIRSISKFDNIPVVMFSSKLSAIDKKESFDAGADGFITKPFSSRGFISGIKTYLNLGRMQ